MQTVKKLITSAVASINEDKALSLVRYGVARGMDPFALLEEVRAGLEMVGTMYGQGKYFLADLIMAAEIYKQAQQMVLSSCAPDTASGSPQVLFGTVEKDIHDIGKNIAVTTMRHYGLNILDLGVDVAGNVFMEKLHETGATILCLSGLISDSYDSMKKTIGMLRQEKFPTYTTVIIGGLVNEAICEYTGADYWVRSCTAGADLCLKILQNKENLALPRSGGRGEV